MKTFASKEKQAAPAGRKTGPYVHHPMGPAQQAQQAEVRHILRTTGAQAKLSIGQPDDKYEQEADRVADQVMRMPDPKLQRQPENEEEEEMLQAKPLADQITPLVQRQEEPEEEEEVEPGKEEEQEESPPILESVPTQDADELGEDEEPIQAKLIQRQPVNEEEEETLQTKPLSNQITPLVQRQKEPEEEEEPIQTKRLSNESPSISAGLQMRIQSLKGGGQPLPGSERAFFEPRFGRDFSSVRIHTDSNAAHLARSINARAFTVGRDVVFGSGQYSAESSSGKQLLAHELTHVVQQRGSATNKNNVQRWGPGDHYKITTSGVNKNEHLQNPSGFFRNTLGVSSTKMDMKIPELDFNIKGKIIGEIPIEKKKRVRLLQKHYRLNQFNARNHGEGGCYLSDESKARTINIKQQNSYLAKARIKSIPFFLANPVSKYPLAMPILYDIGDAIHIAQDRGSHGEGAIGKGHANEIMTGKNPDDPILNDKGYEKSKENTSKVLTSVSRILNAIFGLKFFDHLWNQIRRTGKAVKRLVKSLLRQFRQLVRKVISIVITLVKGLWRAVQAIVGIVSSIVSAASKVVNKLLRVANAIVRRIVNGVKSALRRAIKFSHWIMKKTVRGVWISVRFLLKTGKTIYYKTRKGAKKVFNAVGSGLRNAIKKSSQAAGKAKKIVLWGFGKAKNTVFNAAGAVKRRVRSSLNRLTGLRWNPF